MPIHFQYNPTNNLLYSTVEGQVTLEDLGQALAQITHSKEFPPDINALWDLRKLDFSSLDTEFATNLTAIRQQTPERGTAKIAIIADKDLSFGMSRMYEMLSDNLPQKIMVFRDTSSAETWLLAENQNEPNAIALARHPE